MIMADEHLPADWRDLINARLDWEQKQRQRRDRRRGAQSVPQLSDEEYQKE
jgi:hypothetical protein